MAKRMTAQCAARASSRASGRRAFTAAIRIDWPRKLASSQPARRISSAAKSGGRNASSSAVALWAPEAPRRHAGAGEEEKIAQNARRPSTRTGRAARRSAAATRPRPSAPSPGRSRARARRARAPLWRRSQQHAERQEHDEHEESGQDGGEPFRVSRRADQTPSPQRSRMGRYHLERTPGTMRRNADPSAPGRSPPGRGHPHGLRRRKTVDEGGRALHHRRVPARLRRVFEDEERHPRRGVSARARLVEMNPRRATAPPRRRLLPHR